MHYPKYLISLFLISFLIVLLDQIWKFAMVEVLIYGNSVPVIEGFFSLTLVFNTGAAFGIFPDSRNLFLVLPVLTVILVLFLFLKAENKKGFVLPLAFLLGGTIGNFIDRVRCGYVIDFFDFYWRSYHWPAFNFADISICIGIAVLIWEMLFKSQNAKRKIKDGRTTLYPN